MPAIQVKHIISYTSQDPKYTVKNLVDGKGSWLNQSTDKSIALKADLQLEMATKISYIDIGNAGSAAIGVEVGRSAWPIDRPYVSLIAPVTFMTNSSEIKTSVRMFKAEDMNEAAREEEWDRVRIVCMQPFRDRTQFGVSMFKMYSECKIPKPLPTTVQNENLNPSLSKKNELLAKLKVASPQNKFVVSDNVKMLGGMKPHPNRCENVSLTRGVQLLTHATKLPTQTEMAEEKIILEQESLSYLMSLEWSASDIENINFIKLSKAFQERREKPLSPAEMKIFKAITIDYGKRRLEQLNENGSHASSSSSSGSITSDSSLKTPKRKLERSNEVKKMDKSISNGPRAFLNKLKFQEAKSLKRTQEKREETNGSVESPQKKKKSIIRREDEDDNQENKIVTKKFTFGQSKRLTSPEEYKSLKRQENKKKETNTPVRRLEFVQAKKSSPRSLIIEDSESDEEEKCKYLKNSTIMNKKREGNNSVHKNFTPIRIQPPKLPKKRNTRKKPKNNKLQEQSLLGQWITPQSKAKILNENTKSQSSSRAFYDSDSDIESIHEDSDISSISTPKTSHEIVSLSKPSIITSKTFADVSKGESLGASPADKFNLNRRGERRPTSSSSSSSLNQKEQLVKCPLCSKYFQSCDIMEHASSCNLIALDSDDDNTTNRNQPSTSGLTEECPVCGIAVALKNLESHATQCASNMFDG